jgi:hypothetical protein
LQKRPGRGTSLSRDPSPEPVAIDALITGLCLNRGCAQSIMQTIGLLVHGFAGPLGG